MKYIVAIRSKPGLVKPFKSMIIVEAMDHAQAVQIAIIKAKNSEKRFKYRMTHDWLIDSVTPVENE